jgi:hypothetical protein
VTGTRNLYPLRRGGNGGRRADNNVADTAAWSPTEVGLYQDLPSPRQFTNPPRSAATLANHGRHAEVMMTGFDWYVMDDRRLTPMQRT